MTGLAPGPGQRSSVTAGGDLGLLSLRVVGTPWHVEAEMTGLDAGVRDVAVLKVARVGRVAETGDRLRPFVVSDRDHSGSVYFRKVTTIFSIISSIVP